MQKDTANTDVKEFTAYVFFSSFLVPGPTFESLIHFEFILVYGIRKWSSFFFLMRLSVFPTPLTEETVFIPFYILVFFCC